MRVLFAAAEMEPFASTGGLGDVIGSLPAALACQGAQVSVVLPLYRSIDRKKFGIEPTGGSGRVRVGGRMKRYRVFKVRQGELDVHFIDQPSYFGRDLIYGTTDIDFPDNAERFTFLSRAACELAAGLQPRPAVIHAHDWHTALVPVLASRDPAISDKLGGTATLLTIHNLGYQGIFPAQELATTGLPPSVFNPLELEFWGKLNFLKGGIVFADAVTTVSRCYAEEILTADYGFGLEDVMGQHREKLFGILNGADYERWNPETDPFLPARYSREQPAGKHKCKLALQRKLKLAVDDSVPLVGMVGRLVEQKGLELVVGGIEKLMAGPVQVAVLGIGAERFHQALLGFAERWPGKFACVIGFDEGLSHLIEAGSDLFLMPSRYEPCGLNQIYSLRYGTIPVVRATGGLDDTVTDARPDPATGNGFKFKDFSVEAMLRTLGEALGIYRRGGQLWKLIMDNAFTANFSWEKSAERYLEVYERAIRFKKKKTVF